MSSLNELLRDLRVTEVVTALLNAYRLGNKEYLKSALDAIHEETTFVVSENEELSGEAMRRVSILHSLYSMCLGMIWKMEGVGEAADYEGLITNALRDNDLTSLTLALTNLTMRALDGDSTWIQRVRGLVEGWGEGLVKSVIMEFLNMVVIINPS
ncbi:hypothetical protein [Vulcanisaeta thermophila]|uniref:hypothetical protein n=1 Tax=Vulcanisaeta thermophila TaxID=867917 RepID=UPI0008529CF9|nr:hypothetical protein [Vulcanisaeta thermophila]